MSDAIKTTRPNHHSPGPRQRDLREQHAMNYVLRYNPKPVKRTTSYSTVPRGSSWCQWIHHFLTVKAFPTFTFTWGKR